MNNTPDQITEQVTERLIDLYDFYNQHLFGNELNAEMCRPLITTGRLNTHGNGKYSTRGVYYPYDSKAGKDQLQSAITIDRELIGKSYQTSKWEQVHSTLVHEMVHQYCYEILKAIPNKGGHGHGIEWRRTMKTLGLTPIPVAKGTNKWRSASQEIIDDGLFHSKYSEISEDDRGFPEFLVFPTSKTQATSRSWRRNCPACGRGYQFSSKSTDDDMVICMGKHSSQIHDIHIIWKDPEKEITNVGISLV